MRRFFRRASYIVAYPFMILLCLMAAAPDDKLCFDYCWLRWHEHFREAWNYED